MNYRRLLSDDLKAVADLEAAVQIDPWSRAQVLAVDELLRVNYHAWVATSEQSIIGYLIVQNVVDAFEILTIGVAQAQQGRGIGLALWQHGWSDLCALHPEIDRCFLEVRASNRAAQALYARCGFKPMSKRTDYYQNPREDAFILHKHNAHTT